MCVAAQVANASYLELRFELSCDAHLLSLAWSSKRFVGYLQGGMVAIFSLDEKWTMYGMLKDASVGGGVKGNPCQWYNYTALYALSIHIW